MAWEIPNPHLSLWPSGTGSWAYYLAWIVQIALSIAAIYVTVKLWTYRNMFPLTVAPVHIVGGSTLSMMTASYSYLHPLLTPTIPCWVHILVVQLTYIPTAAYGCTTHLHLWLTYRCQASMAAGDVNSWFVRKRATYEGYRLIIMVVLFTLVVTMVYPAYRLLSRDGQTLSLPMEDLRCTSLTTPEFIINLVTNNFFVIVTKRVAANLEEVREAYPFRQQSQRVANIVAVGFVFLEAPFWLKQFLTNGSLTRSIFDNLRWFTIFVWIATYLLPYLYLIPIQLLISAQKTKKQQEALGRNSFSSSSQVSRASRSSGSAEYETRKARNISDLKKELSGSKDIQLQFKEYMVRELAVENVMFLMALEDFYLKADTRAGVATAQDIVQNYLSPNATYEINISSSLRKHIMTSIKEAVQSGKDGIIAADLFQKAEDEVYGMLLGPYNRFLHWSVGQQEGPGGYGTKKVPTVGKVAPSSIVSQTKRWLR